MGTDDRLKKLVAKQPKKPSSSSEPKKPKKSTEPVIDLALIDQMSESELVEISQLMGLQASRQMPREDLIDLILGVSETLHVDP
ncbi:hypothetical protein EB061_11640, partial [bacterium]|nr:hypothetical protein [bacterium]